MITGGPRAEPGDGQPPSNTATAGRRQLIHAPGPRLLTHVGLSCRGRVGRGPPRAGGRAAAAPGGRPRRRPVAAGLLLTPLIDVMIVMVCFLLLTFRAEVQLCGCGAGPIQLPLARLAGPLLRAPIVAVSPPYGDDLAGVVTLDGAEVATLREVLDDSSPDWKIARLTEQLEVKQHNWRLTNPGQRFEGGVVVQCDREIDFRALKKIIYSVGLAGYAHLQLAVDRPGPEARD